MAHSNSSLNCFTDCMKKYEHQYILRTPPCMPQSKHLVFGSMAHEVLAKAGQLRDEAADGVVSIGEYRTIIPSEVLYQELKNDFAIKSWDRYFQAVIKQTAAYERELIDEIQKLSGSTLELVREKKLQLSVDELQDAFPGNNIQQPLVGVIDLLIIAGDYAIIVDYKFSTKNKTQDDFDMDSQLQNYSLLVSRRYNIPLRNIQIGYIDIPKKSFDEPKVLTNGTLSRAKDQNCSAEMYKKAVTAIHEDDPIYNCEPGGYYYDIYCNLSLNKAAYLSKQWLDLDVYDAIVADVIRTCKTIDLMKQLNMPFLRKYNAYNCSFCEFLRDCKPWLYIDNNKIFKE